MPEQIITDVAVVGAGVHGASITMHLAARSVDVTLLERHEPAGGPTGRSSAACRAYYTDPFLARVAREAVDAFASFGELTGGRDAGFHRTGGLFLHSAEEAAEVEATVAALQRIGTRTDLLSQEEARTRFPRFDLDDVRVAAWEHDAGYADPVLTTTGMVERARELGARLLQRSEVTRLSLATGDRSVELGLADGRHVSAGQVVLATGPWTAALAAQLGIELPLTVERHIVADVRWGDAPPFEHVFADIQQGYYAKPEPSGGFLLGPLTPEPPIEDPDRFDERIHDDELTELTGRAVRRVPDLSMAQPRGGWASLYDVSPDWQPVIGEIAPGVFVDAGTSGHGFKLAPAIGRHVADLVLGDPDPELAAFGPQRFEDGHTRAGGYGEARILG